MSSHSSTLLHYCQYNLNIQVRANIFEFNVYNFGIIRVFLKIFRIINNLDKPVSLHAI